MEKFKKKKVATAATATVLAAALALGGTLAFTDLNQSAVNWWKQTVNVDTEEVTGGKQEAGSEHEIEGPKQYEKVLLHDDFAGGTNKDVYVENTSTAPNCYEMVRVRFTEYFSEQEAYDTTPTSGTVVIPDKTLNNVNASELDTSTWPVHSFKDDTAITGTSSTAAIDCGGIEHDMYTWVMSGNSKKYYKGQSGASNGFRKDVADDYLNASTHGATAAIPDNPSTPENEAKRETVATTDSDWSTTAANATPILLSAYNADVAANKTAATSTNIDAFEKGCWVIDNTDANGWCYWSKLLAPGQATNMLLDGVNISIPNDKNVTYKINVELQAASSAQQDIFFNKVADVKKENIATDPSSKLVLAIFNSNEGTKNVVNGADGAKYIDLGNNIFQKAQLVAGSTDRYVATTDKPITAGIDLKPGNTDDMLLSGRTTAMGGQIAARNIDVATKTYKITGAKEQYVVSMGDDYLLGTLDDVITDTTDAATLGKYYFSNATNKDEKVTWQYLGGAVGNMLLITEYVYDSTKFNPTSSAGNAYEGSTLETKVSAFASDASIAVAINPGETLSMVDYNGNMLLGTCINAAHLSAHSHDTGACTTGDGKYTTVTPTQNNMTNVRTFALSIAEAETAFGKDSTNHLNQDNSQAKGAPYALASNPGAAEAGKNSYDNRFVDGMGNPIAATSYYLRSPGYNTTRMTYIYNSGSISSTGWVDGGGIGMRPAMHANLV